MRSEEVLERVQAIFKEVFNDTSLFVSDTTLAKEWDSFERTDLIAAIEEKFGIRFPMKKIMTAQTIGEIVDTILEMEGLSS